MTIVLRPTYKYCKNTFVFITNGIITVDNKLHAFLDADCSCDVTMLLTGNEFLTALLYEQFVVQTSLDFVNQNLLLEK